MAVPGYLASSYRYLKLTGVGDSQAILDALDTELEAASWTDEGSGTYKSPVDADGRFFKITITRVPTTGLEMTVKDQNGTSVCVRRAYTSGVTSTVYIFVGQYHLFIEIVRGSAAPEYLAAGILDFGPENQSQSSRYVYGGGKRNSATNDYNDYIDNWAMIDNVTATIMARGMMLRPYSHDYAPLYTPGNNLIFHPLCLFATTASMTMAYAGRMYQTILLYNWACESGDIIAVPIDGSTLANFCVVRGPQSVNGMIMAIRQS